MRRVVVLGVLLAVMLGLDALKVDATGRSSLTLAAIGFVLLAAFTVAEVGTLLRLPRVTGYIVSGLVLGPSAFDILSHDVVTEMRMFNSLALGLIAIGAGLELDVREIARVWKTLAATIVVKVIVGATLVAATLYAIQSAFGLLELESRAHLAALSLVLGALSIGTSPAIALAVKNETKARGRLTDLTLGAAVVKDLVVVVCLAVTVTAGRGILGEADAGHDAVLDVMVELGNSVGAGLALGALLVAYIRFVRAEMLLFVAAMILVVSELGRALHLELLLVFITAGFVVRNLSKYEHALGGPVQMVALPVFVVFFTNAGAGIDVGTTFRVLPLALAMCLARAVAYAIAARLGGRFGGESEFIRKQGWLAYLPQAGVTLGLVGVAAHQLPGLAGAITTTGMATVAINLLLGPVALRRALKGAGEVPEVEAAAEPAHLAPAEGADAEAAELVRDDEVALRLERAVTKLDAPLLSPLVSELFAELRAVLDAFVLERLVPWTRSYGQSVEGLLRGTPETRLEGFASWLGGAEAVQMEDRADACRELYRRLRQPLRRCPEDISVPLGERQWKVQRGDRTAVWFRKRWLALRRLLSFGAYRPLRHVPVRALVRRELEPRVAVLAAQLLGLWARSQAAVFEQLRRAAEGQLDVAQMLSETKRHLELLVERFESDAKVAFLSGLDAAVDVLSRIDGPELPRRRVRLVASELEIAQMLERIDSDAERWSAALDAERGSLWLRIELAYIEARLVESLNRTVLEPVSESLQQIQDVVEHVGSELDAVKARVAAEAPLSDTERASLTARVAGAFDEELSRRLERGAARFRASASIHHVAVAARAALERLPESLVVASAATPALSAVRPADVSRRSVAPRSEASELVTRRLLPGIDDEVRRISVTVSGTARVVREVLDIALHALGSYAPEEGGHEALIDALERALGRLDEHRRLLSEGAGAAGRGILERAQTSLDDLARLGDAAQEPLVEMGNLWTRAVRAATRAAEPLVQRARDFLRRAARLLERLGGSQLTRDVRRRVRAGEFDAAEIRTYAEREQAVHDVPRQYAALFVLSPVREHRLFVAYDEELREILAFERAWLDGASGSMLVVGARGSGRTSMLNLCELELSAPRLLRPEPLQWRREVGILQALAIDLGVRPRRQAVVDALATTRTTILIDDLEHWFTPDVRGLRELEAFLDLVVLTRRSAFWLVAVEKSTLALFEESVAVREPFARTLSLEPLSADTLGRAIEVRHTQSGRKLRFASNAASALFARLQRADERTLYFRVLARVCDGNLSRAYLAWLRSVHVADDAVVPQVHALVTIGLPFARRLPPAVVAVLVQMLRFGPMDERELSNALRLTPPETRRHLHFLESAGLVEPMAHARDVLRVPLAVRGLVSEGLKNLGAIS